MIPYKSKLTISAVFVNMLALCLSFNSVAVEDSKEYVAKIVSIEGIVDVQKRGETRWDHAQLNDMLFVGDTIQTGKNSRAAFVLHQESTRVRLGQGSRVTLEGEEKEESFLLMIYKGIADFFSHTPRFLKFNTPFVNGNVEGTEFCVRVDQDQTFISVFKGRVRAWAASPGFAGSGRGRPPGSLPGNPRGPRQG